MLEIKTSEVESNTIHFEAGGEDFEAQFVPPSPDGPGLVAHENEWRLSLFTYHTHREGRSLKRSRGEQRPRRKTLGYFATVDDCRQEVLRYFAAEEGQR